MARLLLLLLLPLLRRRRIMIGSALSYAMDIQKFQTLTYRKMVLEAAALLNSLNFF